MTAPRMNKPVRAFLGKVEDAGGSWELSHDGHAKVYDRGGHFLVKLRTHGHKTAEEGGTYRAKLRQVLRRVEEGGGAEQT